MSSILIATSDDGGAEPDDRDRRGPSGPGRKPCFARVLRDFVNPGNHPDFRAESRVYRGSGGSVSSSARVISLADLRSSHAGADALSLRWHTHLHSHPQKTLQGQ